MYGLWTAIRFRRLMLPTAANPSIRGAGLIGESKSAVLDLVGAEQVRWVSPYTVFAHRPGAGVDAAVEAMEGRGLSFPVVVKPDVGQRGAGVRLVRDEAALAAYLEELRQPAVLMLQALATEPEEAGVFYVRRPSEPRGRILSITVKEPPVLVGDGVHTVEALIRADPRLSLQREVFLRRHHAVKDTVLAAGERLPLVFAGNHCQGTRFRDGAELASEGLLERVEAIARSMPGFHFGRFDLKYESAEALRRGEGFHIVEINGAGAETTHIWDPSARLVDAYRALFEQWRLLFEIGEETVAAGAPTIPLWQLLRDIVHYRRAARGYPITG